MVDISQQDPKTNQQQFTVGQLFDLADQSEEQLQEQDKFSENLDALIEKTAQEQTGSVQPQGAESTIPSPAPAVEQSVNPSVLMAGQAPSTLSEANVPAVSAEASQPLPVQQPEAPSVLGSTTVIPPVQPTN